MTTTGWLNPLIAAGQTLESELALLVARYGADAVREAAKKATKKKRGRPAEKDWPLLKPWIDKDVADWLDGSDPFEQRSNYSIAKEFALAHPGYSQFATKDRIERKLAEKRRWMMYATAHSITKKDHPFELHLKAVRGLVAEDSHPVWSKALERTLGTIAHYTERFGDPEQTQSIESLQERLRTPYPNALAAYAPTGVYGRALLRAVRE